MADPICWLDIVEPEDADGLLAETYDLIRRTDGSVHNLYKAMSLRPEPIRWADGHYRAVLHNSENSLPEWFLELVATMVARLASCAYAQTHHGANLRHLVGDAARADAMVDAAAAGREADVLDGKLAALVSYARKLANEPDGMTQEDVSRARNAGADDAEILETAQVAACFSYWVRIINGLGIRIGNETIGRKGGEPRVS
ncbi:MAG: peroxidase-related enzyme [Alphaproteobacteria bacterium]|nr:peroxidase-related enzyme [Alphaproteobacteria bacterium]